MSFIFLWYKGLKHIKGGVDSNSVLNLGVHTSLFSFIWCSIFALTLIDPAVEKQPEGWERWGREAAIFKRLLRWEDDFEYSTFKWSCMCWLQFPSGILPYPKEGVVIPSTPKPGPEEKHSFMGKQIVKEANSEVTETSFEAWKQRADAVVGTILSC